ncbi:hypothetical protein LAJ57_12725, partial [Streptococcus pneumoniae]|uniref:hypothetical protein n=1 Tax=Streptococcus pneumoniae TaxID=1313 RepID=UPI001CBDE07F
AMKEDAPAKPASEMSAAELLRAAADKMDAAEKTGSASPTITDFGEALPGARKDAAPSLKTELSDNDIATQPLSKIWPADEYLSIDDKFASALS